MEIIDKILKLVTLLAVALSPFWFITFFGINLGPTDLLMLIVFFVLILTNRRFFFGPKFLMYPLILFMIFITISTVINYNVVSYTAYVQYFWLFIVVIPITTYYSTDDVWRYQAILTLSAITGIITLHTLYMGLFTSAEWYGGGSTYGWKYGTYNGLYWVIASSALLNLGVAFDNRLRSSLRIFGSIIFIAGSIIITNSRTQSAMLMLLIGSCFILFSLLIKLEKFKLIKAYIFMLIFSVPFIIYFILSNWKYIYVVGNLNSRFTQYRLAFIQGLSEQPFGAGLRSSSDLLGMSIHNFAFSYWFEIGIFALISYLIFIIIIAKCSSFGILNASDFRPIELSLFGMFFATFALLMFQPELVRRFWYIMYAIIIGTFISNNRFVL